MKCAQCRTRFSATDAQPAPGGSSAPGVLLGFTVVLTCSTAVAFVLDVAYVKWVGSVLAFLSRCRFPSHGPIAVLELAWQNKVVGPAQNVGLKTQCDCGHCRSTRTASACIASSRFLPVTPPIFQRFG